MVLTTVQAAARLGVSRFWVWKMIQAGAVPAVKMADRWFIEETDLPILAGLKRGRGRPRKPHIRG